MKLGSISFLAALLLYSCAGNNARPTGVIGLKAMQPIVWDMIQADETAMQNKFSDSAVNLRIESFRLYDQVFAIHKVSRKQFYDSYKYYQENPERYKALMTGVKAIGEKQRKAANQGRR